MATTTTNDDTDRRNNNNNNKIIFDPVVVAKALIDDCYCSSIDEANLLTDIILSDLLLEGNDDDKNNSVVEEEEHRLLASCLSEHLDISISQAKELSKKITIRNDGGEDDEQEDNDDSDSDIVGIIDFDNNENDDDDDGSDELLLLGEGECELCDRYIKLTRHHLIPRSTWPKISKLLERSLTLEKKGETSKALERLGFGLEDKFDELLHLFNNIDSSSTSSNQKIKSILQATCDICRQCHNCVHNTHTNMDLAMEYNTVDKLLSDQRISKFCKWANKQRPPSGNNMIGNTVRR